MTRISMAALAAGLALAGAAATAHAQSAALSPADIVNRHMAAAGKGDVDALLADYADDAVVLVGGKATQGKAAIRAVFAGMFANRPAAGAAASAPPGGGMKTLAVWQEGDVGFVSWQRGAGGPNPVNGEDAFVVKNGRIEVQTVFTGLPAPAGPAPAK